MLSKSRYRKYDAFESFMDVFIPPHKSTAYSYFEKLPKQLQKPNQQLIMKYLILLRHAKSSWKNLSLSDHDRPLNKRGKQAAPMMGKRLLMKSFHPQLILTSTAKRALKTAKLMAKEINLPKHKLQTSSKLYHAMPDEMRAVISQCDDSYQTVMLVAHNPGITYFANELLNERYFYNIPTTGIVTFSIDVSSWQYVLDLNICMKAELVDYDYPKLDS